MWSILRTMAPIGFQERDQAVYHNQSGTETNGTVSDFTDKGMYFGLGKESLYLQIILTLVIGVFGITGNIMTLMVYSKLGFYNTINISYSVLAASDLCCVIASIVNIMGYIDPFFQDPRLQTLTNFAKLFGAYPFFAFSRITGLITAWISVERSLCVVFPIRVKLIITPRVNTAVLCTLIIVGFFPICFMYTSHEIQWQFDPRTNSTILVLVQLNKLQNVALLLFGAVYPMIIWITVVCCTASLVFKLKQSNRWRKHNASGMTSLSPTGTSGTARRIQQRAAVGQGEADHKACNFSSTGSQRQFYLTLGVATKAMTQINSSVNVIIFAVSGQRFRSVLRQILKACFCKSNIPVSPVTANQRRF
ncbi:hypothetical protein EGW08_006933 [Elysia chlorotica]|uniref:G-protein coupled receptors family 1 profile domain-containing protein n=1 Tax=Elysia chlorotica TaxID=188477 RepID=A0A3S1BJN4_ELYCH|nr:hypothetical protein EGW08_006933 [Elysia chlorotica]